LRRVDRLVLRAQSRLGIGDSAIESPDLLLDLRRPEAEDGVRVPARVDAPRLGDVVEDGEKTAVVSLGEGIVLVVGAPRALEGETEPYGRRRLDPVHDVLD